MGVLLPIGAGEKDVEWVNEVLDAKDRRAAGVTAPANGLYLTRVNYPKEFDLPEEPSGIILLG